MKALVIGGTGPTGPYVIDGLLKRGYQVTILHRGTHEIPLPAEVEHIHGDPHFVETLEKAISMRTFEVVVAQYGRLRFTAQVFGGRTPRFISVGGTGVYKGWTNVDISGSTLIPTAEDAPLHNDPQSDSFSYRMVEAEGVVMEAHRVGRFNATHFRYPTVYGPRQLVPQEWSIIRRILDGRKRLILPDGGLAIRSRGYAQNLAQALMLAVDRPAESAGQICNIRDEALLSLKDWVNVICHAMGHQFEFVEMPYSLARPARVYTRRSRHRVLDISKAKQQLGYRDLVPAEKAIELSVRYYLENRPQRGGEVEQQLRDAFDYPVEDRLMDEFATASARIRELAPPRQGFHHPYAHPERPEGT